MNIAKRKKPDLQEQPELMQVKLTLHIQNEPINEPVNERQQTILSIMKQNPSIIREDLANKLGISLATLKRELTSLSVYTNLKVYHFLIKKCTTPNRLRRYA